MENPVINKSRSGVLGLVFLPSRHKPALFLALGFLLSACLTGCTGTTGVTGVGAGLSFDLEYVPKGPDANVFSAQYICGETDSDHPLVRAVYRTEINIINPDDSASHRLNWRVAFVYPSTPPATEPVEAILGPFRGLEINCQDIRSQLSQADHAPSHAIPDDAPLIKGYIIVQSDTDRIRIAGAYSALHKQIHGRQIVDLLPKANCNPTDEGLVVSVRNQGEGDAPETLTRVAITGSLPVDLVTPALAPGEEAELDPVPLPDPEAPSIDFTVKADSGGIVEESNEANNQLEATCEFAPGG